MCDELIRDTLLHTVLLKEMRTFSGELQEYLFWFAHICPLYFLFARPAKNKQTQQQKRNNRRKRTNSVDPCMMQQRNSYEDTVNRDNEYSYM